MRVALLEGPLAEHDLDIYNIEHCRTQIMYSLCEFVAWTTFFGCYGVVLVVSAVSVVVSDFGSCFLQYCRAQRFWM